MLAGSKLYIGGTASTYTDIQEMAHYDLIISSGILPVQQ